MLSATVSSNFRSDSFGAIFSAHGNLFKSIFTMSTTKFGQPVLAHHYLMCLSRLAFKGAQASICNEAEKEPFFIQVYGGTSDTFSRCRDPGILLRDNFLGT